MQHTDYLVAGVVMFCAASLKNATICKLKSTIHNLNLSPYLHVNMWSVERQQILTGHLFISTFLLLNFPIFHLTTQSRGVNK